MCPVCKAVYSGAFGKQDVLTCSQKCLAALDLQTGLAPARFEPEARPAYGQKRSTGDGYDHPDKHGRWRTGRSVEDKRAIVYHQAMYALERNEERFKRFWERFERDGLYPKWAGKISPLQRLSYAYLHLGWEDVKSAAYNLAYDTEVRKDIKKHEWTFEKFAGFLKRFNEYVEHPEAQTSDEQTEAYLDDLFGGIMDEVFPDDQDISKTKEYDGPDDQPGVN